MLRCFDKKDLLNYSAALRLFDQDAVSTGMRTLTVPRTYRLIRQSMLFLMRVGFVSNTVLASRDERHKRIDNNRRLHDNTP